MEHEPCGLLGNSHSAGDLAGTNAILAIENHPHRSEPLVQTDCRIFHYGSDLDGEFALFVMARTLPSVASRIEAAHAIGTADWANHYAIGPAANRKVVNAVVGIGEVHNCLLQALWFVHWLTLHKQENKSINRASQVNNYPISGC
jgi:hypothetical protein